MMQKILLYLTILCCASAALGDTPPARVINAELYDASGNPVNSTSGSLNVQTTASALPSGAATEATLSTLNGKVTTTGNGVKVDVQASALPSGGATSALQTTGNSSLSSIDGKLTSFDLDTGAGAQNVQGVSLRLSASGGSVEAGTSLNPLRVDPTGTTTQPVAVTSSALPTGAATEATLSALNTKVTTTASGIKVDGSLVTQPISASALPLPTGASTEATLSGLSAKLNSLGQKAMAGSAPVVIASDQSPVPSLVTDGTNTAAVKPAATAPTVSDPALVVSISPNAPITVTSVPPVNAHVSGTLTTACPTGSGCTGGSTVQVATDGYATIGFEAHGTWSGTIGTDVSFDPLCSSSPGAVLWLPTASVDTSNNEASYDITFTEVDNGDPWVMNVSSAQCARLRAVVLTSGTVSLTIDTGVNPSMVWAVDVGNAASGTADVGNPVKVGGVYHSSLPTFTDGQRGDVQLDVNGEVLTALPTNAATASAQSTGNTSLASIDGKTPVLGQAAMAGSVPVVIASNQTPVPASQSGTWNINDITGTISLPSGAATAANQSTVITNLGTIDTDIKASEPRKMQDGAGNALTSSLVNTRQALDIHQADTSFIVSGLSAVGVAPTLNPVSVSGVDGGGLKRHFLTDTGGRIEIDTAQSLPLPSGAATSALQSTGNTSLASIDSKLTDTTGGALKVDGSAFVQPASQSGTWTVQQGSTATTNANGWAVKPGDGTNIQTYTASGEAKVLVTPLTNSSVVKAQLQDNAGAAVTLGQKTMANSLPVTLASDQTAVPDLTASGSITAACGTPSSCSAGTTVSLNTSGRGTATFNLTGTWNATMTIEGTEDGTNWQTLQFMSLANQNVFNNTTSNGTFTVPAAGFSNVRIRCSAFTSGTATVAASASTGHQISFAAQASPWSMRLLDGAGTGVLSTSNALNTFLTNSTIAVTESGAPWTQNVTQFGGTNLSTGTGASGAGIPRVTVASDSAVFSKLEDGAANQLTSTLNQTTKQSLDVNVTTVGQQAMAASIPVAIASNQSAFAVNQGTSAAVANAWRVRQTDGTSDIGTFTSVAGAQVTNSGPGALPGTLAIRMGWDGTTHRESAVDASGDGKIVGNVAAAAADSGNPVKVGGVFNASGAALTAGQRGDVQLDQFGNVSTARGHGTSFRHQAAAATATLKSGSGRLLSVCLNSSAGNGHTMTIWDNTAASGTVIAIPATSGTFGGGCLPYDLEFATGLTFTTSSTDDWTIVYQ